MGSTPTAATAPWHFNAADVTAELGVDVSVGLSLEDAAKRLAKYGHNELTKEPPTPLWKLVLQQFDDMLVKILLGAAVVSFVLAFFEEDPHETGLRAFIEPLVIVTILVLNAVVGVWQESNAEAALEALKELQSETAHVLRGGKVVSDLPARELVPGDVVFLHAGDRVPADIRVVALKTATVRAEQSSLTGESVAVQKTTDPVPQADCELQAKECMLFAGTAIANGSSIGVVTSTGMATEIGKIQSSIQEAGAEEQDTPLKKKLNEFGELLAQVIFYICVVVWAINYKHFMTFTVVPGQALPSIAFSLSKATYYFKIAVALAVAAIPEGLPAVITTCLALGTRTMAKKNAIVRKLPSVETLGCTTVICSDKTGTLTTNQMSAVRLSAIAPSGSAVRTFAVSGHTYSPEDGEVQGLTTVDKALQKLAEVASVCNEAAIEYKSMAFRALGAPTEAALLVLAEKIGTGDAAKTAELRKLQVSNKEEFPEPVVQYYKSKVSTVALLEFDRDRKSMSVIVKSPLDTGFNTLLAKGAAECVLERCNRVMLPDGSVVPLSAAGRAAILKEVEDMAEAALRCLALAWKDDLPAAIAKYHQGDHASPVYKMLQEPSNYSHIESDMIFLGLAGLMDPPRPEVLPAIKQCKQAGIRVMMITGDNKKTAEAISAQIGILDGSVPLDSVSFTGREFVSLPHERQLQILRAAPACVFSRAEPKHKQDIVRLLKELGEVAAMTGDGVNDAPALKLADIGIAMGIAGTEVAKEASDMVLADDNFSSIVAAVSEGRSIYNNMKAFIRYMISSNIGEVASIFLTAMLGLPEGLIPVQLLWVNLVTDGPPATALGFNKADPDIMLKPPRRANELLITPWVFLRYLIIGTYVGVATVGAFVVWYLYDRFLWIDLSQDGHTTITWQQLSDYESCASWEGFKVSDFTAGAQTFTFQDPCDYFTYGKSKASTLSLSVLVAIEMFNALNALSEDNSLLSIGILANPYLLVAIVVSLSLHCVILYIPFMASIFSIVPLSWNEWQLVLLCSLPVVLMDEVLKFVGRRLHAAASRARASGKLKAE